MGLIFLPRACFDRREAPRLGEIIGAAGKDAPRELMAIHPSHETRIRQLNEWMPEALAIRDRYCR